MTNLKVCVILSAEQTTIKFGKTIVSLENIENIQSTNRHNNKIS